jgi:hypothetical protein
MYQRWAVLDLYEELLVLVLKNKLEWIQFWFCFSHNGIWNPVLRPFLQKKSSFPFIYSSENQT